MSIQQEKIIPLINIIRKLQACDPVQLKNSFDTISNILYSHELDEIRLKILLNGLIKVHKSIPLKVYDDILKSLPSESELNITDSITLSDNTNIGFLQVPESIKINGIFNFLEISDLAIMQHTCRCLCIAARNPNSVYYFDDVTFGLQYWDHEWLSKVKKLDIVSKSNISSHYFFGNVRSLFIIFIPLENAPINFKNLLHLNFNINILTNSTWKALTQCTHLETLNITVDEDWDEKVVTTDESLIEGINLFSKAFRKLQKISLCIYNCLPSVFISWLIQCPNCSLIWDQICCNEHHEHQDFFFYE